MCDMYNIEETMDHDSLNGFYEENDLEISDDEPVGTDALMSWKAFCSDEKGEKNKDILAGAATLASRQGEYILDGIAVDSRYRGSFLGTKLLDKVIDEIKSRGGSRLFLVARAPEFFRSYGFRTVARDDAPMFFECFGCEQYNEKCFPEVMRYDITDIPQRRTSA